MKKKICQYALMTALCICAVAAFMMLCGEDAPDRTMSVKLFLTIKLGGLALIWACIKAHNILERKGMLPKINEKRL